MSKAKKNKKKNNCIKKVILSLLKKMETSKKTIFLGGDHGGFELKEFLKQYLVENNYTVEDVGSYTPERVDYPDYAGKVCEGVHKDVNSVGIVVCGSGIGISIAANKFKGIRCTNCNDIYSAKMARKKDDANVLSLGCRVIGEESAKMITDTFLNTKFEGDIEQFAKRLKKIKEIEEANLKA